MRPSLVIFDCDGVLVDSEPVANRILTHALGAAGLKLTVEEADRAMRGMSMTSALAWAEGRLGRSLDPDFLDQVQAETFAAFRRELEPIPGAPAAVAAVQAAGILHCVASSGAFEKMRLTLGLTGLAGRFDDRLFSAGQVKRGKPHPDLFLFAAARMNTAPNVAVVVEDSLPGVEAGIAAGMAVLAYTGEGRDPAPLAAAGGQVFTDMADLPGLLGIGRDCWE